MLALLICLGSELAWSDDEVPAEPPAETTEEAPAEETEEAPAEEAAETEEPPEGESTDEGWEDATEEAIEEAIEEAVEETPIEEAAPAETAPPTLGYHQGFAAGQADSKLANDYALHGLAGFGAGCLVGPCGCVAVPDIEAVVVPGVPAGPWQSYDQEYQQGYIEGYRRGVQRRRVVYSLVGASVGTVIGVGTGLAFGAFVS